MVWLSLVSAAVYKTQVYKTDGVSTRNPRDVPISLMFISRAVRKLRLSFLSVILHLKLKAESVNLPIASSESELCCVFHLLLTAVT